MTGALSAAAAGVGSFFRQQAAAVTQGHWQILQLAQTHTPGLLHAWVLAGNGMYCVPLRVPRILYINSETPPGDPAAAVLGTRTTRILPEGARALHVYKVSHLQQLEGFCMLYPPEGLPPPSRTWPEMKISATCMTCEDGCAFTVGQESTECLFISLTLLPPPLPPTQTNFSSSLTLRFQQLDGLMPCLHVAALMGLWSGQLGTIALVVECVRVPLQFQHTFLSDLLCRCRLCLASSSIVVIPCIS